MFSRLLKGLILAAVCLVGPRFAFAASQARQSDAVWANFKWAVAGDSTAIVVDLSNTTSWPHKDAGSVNILAYKLEIDRITLSTVSVNVGVITSINASSGTVSWFLTKEFVRNSTGTISLGESMNLYPSQINTYVDSSGVTPYLITSESTTLNDAEALSYQNDIPMATLRGVTNHVMPSKGDILLRIRSGNSPSLTTVLLSLLYFVIP